MRTCVSVQRIPPMKEASSTMVKPSRLNWADSNVNMNRPLAISRITRIRNGFWWKGMEERERGTQQEKRMEDDKMMRNTD